MRERRRPALLSGRHRCESRRRNRRLRHLQAPRCAPSLLARRHRGSPPAPRGDVVMREALDCRALRGGCCRPARYASGHAPCKATNIVDEYVKPQYRRSGKERASSTVCLRGAEGCASTCRRAEAKLARRAMRTRPRPGLLPRRTALDQCAQMAAARPTVPDAGGRREAACLADDAESFPSWLPAMPRDRHLPNECRGGTQACCRAGTQCWPTESFADHRA